MADYYYLVSSLPMLDQFGKPAITLDEFLDSCEQWLTKSDLKVVSELNIVPKAPGIFPSYTAAANWNDWEIALRNRLARVRGGKINKEPGDELLFEVGGYQEQEKAIMELSSVNPAEAEKLLDELRWSALEHFEGAHQFDIDKLSTYKIKLMICEKWQPRTQEQGNENFEKIIAEIYE
jgi:hypothetical protein